MEIIRRILDKLLDFFCHPLFTLLGQESALASVWMFTSLLIRTVVIRLNLPVPPGFIFAFPMLAQKLASIHGCAHPLLVVRVMESLMGRTKAKHLTIVIPAHFVGHIIGAVLFSSVLGPVLGTGAMDPISFQSANPTWDMSTDTLYVAAYAILQMVIPELLAVNGISQNWLSLFFLPILLNNKSTFNPCAVYAFWFIGGYKRVQLQRIVAPFVGSLLANVFCAVVTPDDPKSWRAVSFKRR